ncbi:MAG: flagellar protein FliS [Alphaproteobacteria bacterium]|nr:flagellar protein FliS [Alphaproteobacteria bacterium]
MMTTNQQEVYGNAAQAYQQTGQTALNPVEIVLALYEGILRNLEGAKNSYVENDLENMCALNEKTFRILAALQSHLDFEKGGDTAPALDDFYRILFMRLTKVLEKDDPAQEFDYLKSNVRDIYSKWSLLTKKIIDQQKEMAEQGRVSVQE